MYDVKIFNCPHSSEGKPIPTELRKDEAALRKAIEFDDQKHERKYMQICAFYSLSTVYLGLVVYKLFRVVFSFTQKPFRELLLTCPYAGTEGGFN